MLSCVISWLCVFNHMTRILGRVRFASTPSLKWNIIVPYLHCTDFQFSIRLVPKRQLFSFHSVATRIFHFPPLNLKRQFSECLKRENRLRPKKEKKKFSSSKLVEKIMWFFLAENILPFHFISGIPSLVCNVTEISDNRRLRNLCEASYVAFAPSRQKQVRVSSRCAFSTYPPTYSTSNNYTNISLI